SGLGSGDEPTPPLRVVHLLPNDRTAYLVMSLTSPTTPWCTIFLVVGSLVFNALVLYGNTMTSSALKEVGESTRGWSNVGNGIASSLKTEIDVVMNNVSIMLLDSLEHVSGAQGQLEMVLSMVGNETDNAVAKHPELSLLQEHGPEKGLALLQEKHGKNESHVEALVPLVLTAVHQVLEVVMSKVSEGLHTLMIKIKPALIQVGKWIQQFGAKVQAGLEDFSLTLDKAQKMFDQVMAQMKGTANNSDQMMFETWPIFDDDGSGSVSATELSNVGDWFSISALQGKKAPELVKKYDTSGDGTLERKEFHALVNDPSIPGSLSVILRKYAKRLAEIAGQVGRALMRDDVANSVAAYVRLVCAKNMTKVGWISDRLGNGSVPLDFTGTVFVEMCLAAKDPNAQVYTSADTGLILTQEVYNLHPEAMLQAVDLMSNASWWTGQGYNLQDQPACVKMATGWITQVESGNGVSLLGLGQSGTEEEQFLSQMPEAAYMLAEEGVKLYRLQRLQARQQRRAQLYTSQTSQLLLQRLLGGQSPTDGTSEETQAAATGGGVPAVNSTLEFAQFLEWNATDRAKELQRYSFDYSSESSNAIDDFASKIQAMIKKVSSFISLMEKYSTEKGITDLENQVEQFLNNALEDVSKTIEQKLAGLITANAPKLDQAIHAAAHSAGERLGAMIGQVISSPMIQALEAPLEEVLSSSLGNATGASIGSTMSASLGMEISNLTAGTLGAKLGDALEGLVDDALEKAGEGLQDLTKKLPQVPQASTQMLSLDKVDAEIDRLFARPYVSPRQRRAALLQQGQDSKDVGAAISSAWTNIVNLLRTFSNLLPTAVNTLKDARAEVSKLTAGLDSIFSTFEVKGPTIFNEIASIWTMIWVGYFCFLLPFSLFTLYYGFWANGWFGGPKPMDDEPEGPQTLWQRMSLLCSKCLCCCCRNHDSDLCFWGVIIFMQVIVLLTFLIFVVLALFAAVKALLMVGCAQVYVLKDEHVCETALVTLRSFLTKLPLGNNTIYSDEDVSGACDQHTLLTCEMVTAKFAKSTIFTTVFSFLSTIFALQMLFNAATLHEQAVWRRKAAAIKAGKTD
ncbi:unnamed protein product, partial [Effrenium voratum]